MVKLTGKENLKVLTFLLFKKNVMNEITTNGIHTSILCFSFLRCKNVLKSIMKGNLSGIHIHSQVVKTTPYEILLYIFKRKRK